MVIIDLYNAGTDHSVMYLIVSRMLIDANKSYIGIGAPQQVDDILLFFRYFSYSSKCGTNSILLLIRVKRQ
jgi:hypothetical protein